MEDHLRGGLALGPLRLGVTLGTLFALVGVALALVGVYGVAVFAARRRLHEIGIRLALGAEPRDILKLVVGQGLGGAAAGGAFGVAAACLLTRFMRSVLIGVSPTDPLTLA